MARKRHYSNYGDYSRGNRYNSKRSKGLQLYIGMIIVALITIGGIFFGRAIYQVMHLKMVEVGSDPVSFEPIQEVTQWHNQEARFAYLTFNDGPTENAEEIMDILAAHGVQGTFFVLGTTVQNNPNAADILKRMVDEGHYIGLHTMTRDPNHIYALDRGAQNFLDEMRELQELVKDLTGGFESQLCRAPFATDSPWFSDAHERVMAQSEFNCWDWHIDTNDLANRSIDLIMHRVESGMTAWGYPNHAVILFHESDIAVESLPTVIEYLKSLGYEIVAYNPNRHVPVNRLNNPDL